MDSVKQFVISELRKRYENIDPNAKSVVLKCAFHSDNNPSMSVLLEHKKYKPGTFHCFSCDASGGWNKLATQIGLEKLSTEVVLESDPFYALKQRNSIDLDSFADSVPRLPRSIAPWPVAQDWRGFSGKFLNNVGAQKWWDNKSNIYRVLIEVTNGDGVVGYVGARTDDKTDPKYRNAPGNWAKDNWLGYEWKKHSRIRKVWEQFDGQSVAIVEGPVDWLRCIAKGVPALGLFGVNNISPVKYSMLVALGVRHVVLFLDGDEAGYTCARELKSSIPKGIKVSCVSLPISESKHEQIDPGNCPDEFFELVKSQMRKFQNRRNHEEES